MSVDGYKIAIQLSLVENVAKGLASLAPHFTNANLSAKQLEERLERIGKLTLAGGAMAGVGAFLLKGFIKPSLDAAKDLARATADFETLNLSASDMAEVKSKSLEMSHKVLGTTIAGNIRLIQDLHTAFGSLEHAMPMAESFAKYETAIKGAYGVHAADGLVNAAAKALEHRGGKVTNDPEEFKRELQMMSQAQFATKGRISSKDFLAMSQTGKMAYQLWDKDFLYGKAAAMGTIYGGAQLGTMGMTSFSSLIGGHMDSKAKGFLADLGLYQEGFSKARLGLVKSAMRGMSDSDKRAYEASMGGHQILTGGLKDNYAAIMANDPSKFAAILSDAIRSRFGVTDPEKIAEIAAKNFNRNTGAFLGGLITNAQKLIKDEAIFKRAMDFNQAFDHYQSSPDGAANALSAAFTNLKAVMGSALLPSVISATLTLAKFVNAVSDFFEKNPWAAKAVMWFTAIASAALMMGGGLLLVKAALSGFSLILPSVASGLVATEAAAAPLMIGGVAIAPVLLGLGALVAAVAGLSYVLPKVFGNGITDADHPGQHFSRHGRGANNGVWIDDNTGKPVGSDAVKPKSSHEGQHFVRAGRGGSWIDDKPLQITVVSKLDGRVVAQNTAMHIAREASRPGAGAPTYDPSMGPVPVGLN